MSNRAINQIKEQLSRQFSNSFSEAESMAQEYIDPTALAEMIKNASLVLVIDVREASEFAAGHIINSVSCPYANFSDSPDALPLIAIIQDYVTRRRDSASGQMTLVFASLRSPDLDGVAASLVQATSERDSDNNILRSNNITVRLLLGGIAHWMELYKNDTALTADVDKSIWGE